MTIDELLEECLKLEPGQIGRFILSTTPQAGLLTLTESNYLKRRGPEEVAKGVKIRLYKDIKDGRNIKAECNTTQ